MMTPPHKFPNVTRLCAMVTKSVAIEEAGDDVRAIFLEVARLAKAEADAANQELHAMRGALAQLYRSVQPISASAPQNERDTHTLRYNEAFARCYNLGRRVAGEGER